MVYFEALRQECCGAIHERLRISRHLAVSLSRLALQIASAALLVSLIGCSRDDLFGPGGGVSVSVSTPTGVQTGAVRIVFTLSDDDETTADIAVRYSADGGATFLPATAAAASVGTSSLTVSPTGTSHAFVWDSAADLGDARIEDARIRISSDGGKNDATEDFALHNGRFLVVSRDVQAAQLSLYRLDANDGDLMAVQTVNSGGQRPWDVLFHDDRFFVANRDSNDVSVLALDESTPKLTSIDSSPFATDGTGGKYLATDGNYLFVANIGSATISVFDIDSDTGALTLTASSGVAAAHCRTMVARSGRLYVASENDGAILVFDIGANGNLEVHAHSPIKTGGLASPVALARVGTRLYAANWGAATLAGFNIGTDGSLTAIAGAPFTFTGSQALAIAATPAADRLFVATQSVGSFASMALDVLGIATQDTASPYTAKGTTHTAVAVGDVVVVGSGAGKSVESFTIASGGTLTAADDETLSVEVGRLGVSD